IVLWQVGFGGETLRGPGLRWLAPGALGVGWGLRVGTVTAVMLGGGNTGSRLVRPYSLRFMHEGRHRPRLLSLLSLFTLPLLARASLPISPCSPSPCWRW